jgi:hypothetical protein
MGGMNMFGVGGVGSLILLGLDIWAIISVLGSDATSGRRALWVLLIVVLPLLGFLIWLVAGPRSSATRV